MLLCALRLMSIESKLTTSSIYHCSCMEKEVSHIANADDSCNSLNICTCVSVCIRYLSRFGNYLLKFSFSSPAFMRFCPLMKLAIKILFLIVHAHTIEHELNLATFLENGYIPCDKRCVTQNAGTFVYIIMFQESKKLIFKE